jgi:hypothetical protein
VTGCVVLIADLLGDETGWAWRDRVRDDGVRDRAFVPDGDGRRGMLAGRVRTSIDALSSQPGVDPRRIGALGFCLGEHPILELARMRRTTDPKARVMATFHGLFDGVRDLEHLDPIEGGGRLPPTTTWTRAAISSFVSERTISTFYRRISMRRQGWSMTWDVEAGS